MLETTTNGAGAAAVREDERAVGELGFGDGGRAAGAGVPDPELVEQAKRRKFTAKYKLEILEKADACTQPPVEEGGGLGFEAGVLLFDHLVVLSGQRNRPAHGCI